MQKNEKIIKARDTLLDEARALIISVSDDDAKPDIGSSPFWRASNGTIYIYTSELSSHVRSLLKGNEARFLFIEDEEKSQTIWARVRIKFEANCTVIERKTPQFEDIMSHMKPHFGATMDLISQFQDFHLIEICPTKGVLVTGFASAYEVSGPHFTILEKLSKS
ncbi:MAG: pyridoxamine 5'-phosphate oxidase family protein [Candidatus Puniceispirillaceae bacterium]